MELLHLPNRCSNRIIEVLSGYSSGLKTEWKHKNDTPTNSARNPENCRVPGMIKVRKRNANCGVSLDAVVYPEVVASRRRVSLCCVQMDTISDYVTCVLLNTFLPSLTQRRVFLTCGTNVGLF